MIPVRPPIVKRPRNPSANMSGARKIRWPRHRVASQLKIFTEVGTATASEVAAKNACRYVGIPTVNMWCAHTSMLANAMPMVENATAL